LHSLESIFIHLLGFVLWVGGKGVWEDLIRAHPKWPFASWPTLGQINDQKSVVLFSSLFFWQELSPVQSQRSSQERTRAVLELLPSAFSAVPTRRRRSNERWLAYALSVFFFLWICCWTLRYLLQSIAW
jgi:hypothetical protein